MRAPATAAKPGNSAPPSRHPRSPAQAFARYEAGGWAWPAGTFTVQAGRSSRDLPLVMRVKG